MTVSALRGSPLLEALSDEALERLSSQAQEIRLAPGDVLMEEGDDPGAMFVLVDGELDVLKRIGSDEITVGSVGEGELVGELGLLHGRPRSVSLRAADECRLLCIPSEALDELLSHPRSARTLLATATNRLEQQELLVVQHGRMAVLGSLTAGLLHELNNPAAAVGRAVSRLAAAADAVIQAEADLGDDVPRDELERLAGVADRNATPPDPLERADVEAEWREWLERRDVAAPWTVSGSLAAAGVRVDTIEPVSTRLAPQRAGGAARWLAARLELQRLIGEAGTGAGRISEIVTAVKAFSHHDEAPVQDVDVHAGLEAAVTILQHKMPDGLKLERDYADDLPTVDGYPGDLNMVWTNLIDNAIDAVGSSGTVTLTTRVAGEYVVVEVTDDGSGIPPEIADRVFDPFFTTKPVGQGTGIGLATSYAIVKERHHGALDMHSGPGRTTFAVRLPRRHEAASRSPVEDAATGNG